MNEPTPEPPPTPAERAALARVEHRLEAARTEPAPAFRGELGDAVRREAARRHLRARPAGLWRIVMLLGGAGALLIGVAAAQI